MYPARGVSTAQPLLQQLSRDLADDSAGYPQALTLQCRADEFLPERQQESRAVGRCGDVSR